MNPEYYKRSIPLPGAATQFIPATLTYCLLSGPRQHKRTFLLTKYHRDFVTPQLKKAWEHLVKEIESVSTGNFQQDKYFVNKIKEHPSQFQQSDIGIAVHHFGPVPVLFTDHYNVQELHGEIISTQVVLYYHRKEVPGDQFNLLFPNKTVFLQSMEGNYALIMQRYFEDVTQIFRAIVNKSRIPEALKWSKKAEDFIGQSIQSKLKESIPDKEDWKAFKASGTANEIERHVQCQLFTDHYSDIFIAQNFRNTSLYFINELYRHIGIESRSDTYLKRIQESKDLFDLFLGEGTSEALADDFDDSSFLQEVRGLYQSRNLPSLLVLPARSIWQYCMKEFAIFLLGLENNFIDPVKARVFIVYDWSSADPEKVREQISAYLKQHFEDFIEVFSLKEHGTDDDVWETNKSLIWQADLVICIIPNQHRHDVDQLEALYKNLIRQAEYGVFQQKRVMFLLEEDYSKPLLEGVLNDMQMELFGLDDTKSDFITKDPSEKEARLLALNNYFRRKVHPHYRVRSSAVSNDWRSLEQNILDDLNQNAERIITVRHNDLIKGFFGQFPEDTLITLKCLAIIFKEGNQFTKDDAVLELNRRFGVLPKLPFKTKSITRNSFTNAWNNVRTRSLAVSNEPYTLIVIKRDGRDHFYSLGIKNLLRTLQPNISEDRLDKWLDGLFREALGEKYSLIPQI